MAFRYNKYDVIVSIDFGTTFSGTCYSITGSLTPKEIRDKPYEEITHITDWPEQKTYEQKKTHTINIYDQNFHLLYWGKTAFDKIQSGNLDKTYHVVERFKLDLPSSAAQKGAIHQMGNISKEGLLSMRATIDYFREIYDHTVSTIQTNMNALVDSDTKIDKDSIRFVITVPAQWNDVQRAVMRNVAKEAGLVSEEDHENRLLIINESLAATLYCEREKTNGVPKLATNDRYIICDAGGGTVDLATFESTKPGIDGENDSFRRSQLTADSGEKWGSTYLDERMKLLLLKLCFNLDGILENKNEQAVYDDLVKPLLEEFIGKHKIHFGARSKSFVGPKCSHKKENAEVKNQNTNTRREDNSNDDKGINNEYSDDECSDDECSDDECSDDECSDDECSDDECSDGEGSDDEGSYDGDYNTDYEYDDESASFEENSVGPCEICLDEDFVFVEDDLYGESTIFTVRDGSIELEKCCQIDGVTIEIDTKTYTLTIEISYKVMRERVFDEVIRGTLDLLKRQVQKANGKIDRTYLVGGLGCSPYLQKRIKKEFTGKDGNCEVGALITDTKGDSAAMRGAVYYGIDGSRRAPQKDIVEKKFQSGTDKYETLVCLDIGYNATLCSYKDLKDDPTEMIEFTEWPGKDSNDPTNFQIPTAREVVNDTTLWGAQVSQSRDLDPETLIIPSQLMSIVKSDFRKYLVDYLGNVISYVHSKISKDQSKCRYVITMENCYKFFNNKSEMRRIAILAGIIDENDSVERLLLINREDAAALYYEKTHFADSKSFSNHFMQISIYHDVCHLTLHEATKIADYDQHTDENTKTANVSGKTIDEEVSEVNKEVDNSRFRNVRCMRSATLDFSFVGRLVANLDSFVSKSVCISCTASTSHDAYDPSFYIGLRSGFLKYIKDTLDFSKNDEPQKIVISDCCTISISVYDLLEHVFRPAIRDLSSEINRYATQVDMIQKFDIDKIFLSGILLEAKDNTYSFLERIITKNLSEVMNLTSDYIVPINKEFKSKEAIIGAAHYGNYPEDFTERVSRRSYVVKVAGFKPQKFSDDVVKKAKELRENRKKNDAYNLEALHGLIDDKTQVDLYFQSARNPSLKNDESKRSPTQGTFLIHRGDKILERDQMYGLSRKFYAEEDCIVYATIYYSEDTDVEEGDVVNNIDNLDDFQKIHQFEIYVKRDPDDPMTASEGSRVHFDIRFIPDNNEAKFEAHVCSRLGKKIPEFRFRDEFLVANIFDDVSRIKVGNLGIGRKENEVKSLQVANVEQAA